MKMAGYTIIHLKPLSRVSGTSEMTPRGPLLMFSKNSDTLKEKVICTLDGQKWQIGHLTSQTGIDMVKMMNDSNVNNAGRLSSLLERKAS